jgi:hypothetical protein
VFFGQQSQRVLAAAEEEAEGLAHRHVSNHHILLGLLHVEDCFAAQLLRRHGLSADYLREQIPTLLEEKPAPPMANAAIPDTSPAERKLYELDRRVIELFHLNDYQAAMKLVDDAVADPTLNRAQTIRRLVPIASVIARIIGDLDLVKRYCELRLACDPEDTVARYALADCLALQGKTDEAVDTARKAYELNLGSGKVGDGLAELIEKRFPEIKLPGAPRYS